MTRRAGILARISKKDKRVPKVENQVLICQSIADDEGYVIDPKHIFIDDGIAASGKAIDDTTLENRPGSRACLEAMRKGQFDVLLAVEGERLARTYLDGMEFIKASVEGNVIWHLDTDGILDPRTPAGEETAVSIFAQGRREGRTRDMRQKRRYDSERATGMPLWGTRPFGYDVDRITIRESEAKHIRDAVSDYLAGRRSMLRIAKDWNAAGIKTDGMLPTDEDRKAGKTVRERKGRDGVVRPVRGIWTATTVRQLLQRDRNAGLLVHDGVTMPNSRITPIIEVEQLEALKARAKTGTPLGARAQSLLGGVLRCECGAPMHSTISYSQRKHARGNVPAGTRYESRIYKCSQSLYDKTRKHASISQKIADELFIGFVLLDLFNGTLASPQSEDTAAALHSVTERLTANDAAMAHVAEVLFDVSLKSLHAKAKGQLKALEAERVELKDERDVLLSHAEESGGLDAFMAEWRAGTVGFSDADEAADWETRLWVAWNSVSIEGRQGLIKARYRPTVKVGGRGQDRISVNPIDPSTFGQPVEAENEDE